MTMTMTTDEQIREYVRGHWRNPWMDGGHGKGSVNDAAIYNGGRITAGVGAHQITIESDGETVSVACSECGEEQYLVAEVESSPRFSAWIRRHGRPS
jgi:hypothetical protein